MLVNVASFWRKTEMFLNSDTLTFDNRKSDLKNFYKPSIFL